MCTLACRSATSFCYSTYRTDTCIGTVPMVASFRCAHVPSTEQASMFGNILNFSLDDLREEYDDDVERGVAYRNDPSLSHEIKPKIAKIAVKKSSAARKTKTRSPAERSGRHALESSDASRDKDSIPVKEEKKNESTVSMKNKNTSKIKRFGVPKRSSRWTDEINQILAGPRVGAKRVFASRSKVSVLRSNIRKKEMLNHCDNQKYEDDFLFTAGETSVLREVIGESTKGGSDCGGAGTKGISYPATSKLRLRAKLPTYLEIDYEKVRWPLIGTSIAVAMLFVFRWLVYDPPTF